MSHLSPCTPDAACRRYWPGHLVHPIHSGFVQREPWGWRKAVVASIDDDNVAFLEYRDDAGTCRVWHHLDLSVVCPPGTSVQVHEGRHVIAVAHVALNVALVDGIGPVPPPSHGTVTHAPIVVTDLSTGHGILAHPPRK
ncbi:MAG TPA: hypothetical protein VK024_02700 [Actinomycetaceae bacterium]|nr:hypothetical protein [Actinomycetaceae bacterium]